MGSAASRRSTSHLLDLVTRGPPRFVNKGGKKEACDWTAGPSSLEKIKKARNQLGPVRSTRYLFVLNKSLNLNLIINRVVPIGRSTDGCPYQLGGFWIFGYQAITMRIFFWSGGPVRVTRVWSLVELRDHPLPHWDPVRTKYLVHTSLVHCVRVRER